MLRVRPGWVPVAALIALAMSVSVAGAARSGDFRDEFTSFEVRQWVKITRPVGHGTLDPANVTVAEGLLGIKIPAGTLNGGEMRSTSLHRYGTYRTRMKIAYAPSSLTAFFLYKRPDYAQEIDIEIFNDDSGRIMFSTYSGFAQTNNVIVDLSLDLTADFHVYTIEYDAGSVRFLLDGTELQRFSTGVPRSSMYLFANAWFPSWLAGDVATTDRYTYIDWIEHTGR
jgi:endo-1,3-1,4-beta-glycanase ExoK